MYYGRAQQAAEWFHQLGYTLPYRVSLADFILDLASGDVATPDRWALGRDGMGAVRWHGRGGVRLGGMGCGATGRGVGQGLAG